MTITSFHLPTKTSVHLVLNQERARALSNALELQLATDPEARRDLARHQYPTILEQIASDLFNEMRNCGMDVTGL